MSLVTFKVGDVVYYSGDFPNGQVYITAIVGDIADYWNPLTFDNWKLTTSNKTSPIISLITREFEVGDFGWWGDRKCRITVLGKDISSVKLLDTSEVVAVRTKELSRASKLNPVTAGTVVNDVKEKKMAESAGASYNVSIDKISVDFLQSTVKKVLDTEAEVYITKLKKELQPTDQG